MMNGKTARMLRKHARLMSEDKLLNFLTRPWTTKDSKRLWRVISQHERAALRKAVLALMCCLVLFGCAGFERQSHNLEEAIETLTVPECVTIHYWRKGTTRAHEIHTGSGEFCDARD